MGEILTPDLLEGPLRVLAGPGAGKTQALVDLYVDLVRSRLAARSQVLVLTFSTAAAAEIARRVDERLTDSYDESWISTFHSFCARLLHEHRPDPRLLLMSAFQEWLALRATLADMDREALGPLAQVAGSDAFVQDALAFVAMLKQNLVHAPTLALLAEADGTRRLRALAALHLAYRSRCEAAGLCDFRDLVADTIALLESSPDLLERLRRKFHYLLVDEFQDIDPAQFHLLQVLAPPESRPRLLALGDPDQSIYGFRGTVPRLLSEEFPRVYGGRSLDLARSWRCPPEVLEAGRRLLEATQAGRPQRRLESALGRDAGAARVQVVREANAVDEAFYVAREIKRLMLEDPRLRPRDFAVLLRSTAVLSAPFAEAVRAMGLPYEVRGLGTVGRNEVVRFLLSYLRALRRPDDSEALERVLGSVLSGVGPRTAGRLRRHAVEEGRPLTRVVRWLLRWLAQEDPHTYPLPWAPTSSAEPPPGSHAASVDEVLPAPASGQVPPPPFAEHLTEAERQALHCALSVLHRLAHRAAHLPLDALAYAVLVEAGVVERLLALPLEEAERQEALADLRASLEAVRELTEVWRRLQGSPPLLKEVGDRLERWLARAVDETEPAPEAADAVQLLTVHQAKGLEFEVVFLSGFAAGVFPPASRPHPLLEEEDQRWLRYNLPGFAPAWPTDGSEHLAEEARLAYVGMTRARRLLYLTYADEYQEPAGPSPFLEASLPGAPVLGPNRSSLRLEPTSVLTLAEAEAVLAGAPLTTEQRAHLAQLGADLAFLADPEAGQPFEPHRRRPGGVDPGHFSPTSLNDYLKCPRLYWYSHHPGLAPPPRGVEMERGSFLHGLLEEFHRREPEWRTLPPESQRAWLFSLLEERLQAYLQRQEAVLERKAEEQEIRRILSNYISFATSSHPLRRLGTLAVERKFSVEVEGALVHGKIDRINDTGEGTCEVVDYKTGRGQSATRAYENYFGPELLDVQLALYYLACMRGCDEEGRPLALEPRFLSLWYPKEAPRGRMRQVLFTLGEPLPQLDSWSQHRLAREDVERALAVAAEAIRRIRAGDFAPAPRQAVGTCLSWFGCPHSAICPFGGSPGE